MEEYSTNPSYWQHDLISLLTRTWYWTFRSNSEFGARIVTISNQAMLLPPMRRRQRCIVLLNSWWWPKPTWRRDSERPSCSSSSVVPSSLSLAQSLRGKTHQTPQSEALGACSHDISAAMRKKMSKFNSLVISWIATTIDGLASSYAVAKSRILILH